MLKANWLASHTLRFCGLMGLWRWYPTARVLLSALILLLVLPTLDAYSVLTHEAIIDTTWEKELTPEQLRENLKDKLSQVQTTQR